MANTESMSYTNPVGTCGTPISQGGVPDAGMRKRKVYPIAPLFSLTGTGGTPQGAGSPALTAENSVSFVGALIDANSDSVIIHIPVPDDMDTDQTLWVSWWYTFADTSSSGITMTTLYTANVVKDYADAASDTVAVPATAVDGAVCGTTATDVFDCDGGATAYAIQRGKKFWIAGQIFEQDGLISLSNAASAEDGSATLYVNAAELWYVQRKL